MYVLISNYRKWCKVHESNNWVLSKFPHRYLDPPFNSNEARNFMHAAYGITEKDARTRLLEPNGKLLKYETITDSIGGNYCVYCTLN